MNPADLINELGKPYGFYSPAEAAEHAKLLDGLEDHGDIAFLATARDLAMGQWRVVVCARDQPGILSIAAGLFTVFGVGVERADVFTIAATTAETKDRNPHRTRSRTNISRVRPDRPTALDIFDVSISRDRGDTPWSEIELDLRRYVQKITDGSVDDVREEVVDRVSSVLGRPGARDGGLLARAVVDVNDAGDGSTRLSIRSGDTPGFLFAFANALTALGVNIRRAEARTIGDEAIDTFWVTEPGGGPIVGPGRLAALRTAAAMIKRFTELLPASPNPSLAIRQFSALAHQMLSRPDWTRELRDLESRATLQRLAEMMGVSEFLWEDFLRLQHDNLFPLLTDSSELLEPREIGQLRELLARTLAASTSNTDAVSRLNDFKDREMFRSDLRHISRRMDFTAFSAELTDLAEVVVAGASRLAYEELASRHGRPMTDDSQPCPWVVCALGKAGGRELGFGSDIEMVFVYEGEGITEGPEKVDNFRFFGDLVRTLAESVQGRREGIFQIDLRLRPHGSAGSLAASLDGFCSYSSADGDARQFERMALVKLRPIAGNDALGRQVTEARDQYVYSGLPIDLLDVVHMRERQAGELVARDHISAKHSPGGIADIEYFAQAKQIQAGASDPSVRTPNTVEALKLLAEASTVEQGRSEALQFAYGFHRRLIDALRIVRGNAKDLTIPDLDSREFAYLARRLDYDTMEELQKTLERHMTAAATVWIDWNETIATARPE